MEVGYLSYRYAESLSELGAPMFLRSSGSYILERRVPDTNYWDGMGLYPLFCCRDWGGLAQDLKELLHLVSLVVVTDPFCGLGTIDLTNLGFDFAKPYKDHVIVNPKTPSVSKHHRHYARKALEDIEVRVTVGNPGSLGIWCRLYAELVERRGIAGIAAFSRESFAQQFETPGLVAFAGWSKNEIVGMHLWFEQGDVAYSHLAASSEQGYDLMVAYALHSAAIDYFNGRVEKLDLGAGADAGTSGLGWFKKGWSTDTLPAYLCGKVLNERAYGELSGTDQKVHSEGYFPAYRAS